MSILTEDKVRNPKRGRTRLYQDKADYIAANRARNAAELRALWKDKTLCLIRAEWKGEAFKCCCCENKHTTACPEVK